MLIVSTTCVFIETPGMVYDLIDGYCDLAKLMHKINYHKKYMW